jgi:hypothetical protein
MSVVLCERHDVWTDLDVDSEGCHVCNDEAGEKAEARAFIDTYRAEETAIEDARRTLLFSKTAPRSLYKVVESALDLYRGHNSDALGAAYDVILGREKVEA